MEVDEVVGSETAPLEEYESYFPKSLYSNIFSEYGPELFPVQVSVINILRRTSRGDILCNSPTGSGKTLAYAIPVVQALLTRRICRVRAVVIVPVKELVSQVEKVFQTLTKDTPLRVVGLSTGTSLAQEQNRLCEKISDVGLGGKSSVDIVVSTPYRLVEHINLTPGFTLQHLQYLIFDEADRLLSEKLEWIDALFKCINNSQTGSFNFNSDLIDVCTTRDIFFSDQTETEFRLRKLFFSATLKKDSEIAKKLQFANPYFLAASKTKRYVFPETLSQFQIRCENHTKNLYFFWLLSTFTLSDKVLCFTTSVEAAHKLFLYTKIVVANIPALSILNEAFAVGEFSRNQDQKTRKRIIKSFSSGVTKLIICSDILARGIDIEGVTKIVNYEMPSSTPRYIHRVGRTARAGTTGISYALLTPQDQGIFYQVVAKPFKVKVPDLFKESDLGVKAFVEAHGTTIRSGNQVLLDTISREFGQSSSVPQKSRTVSTQTIVLDTNVPDDQAVILESLRNQSKMNFFGLK